MAIRAFSGNKSTQVLDAYIIHGLVASISNAGTLAQKWLWHVATPVNKS